MSVTTPFLGMRGTGDWEADQIPKTYRQKILQLYPNGSAVLTAIMSQMAQEVSPGYMFNWYIKKLAMQGGTIAGIFTDAALTTAYVSGGSAGDTLYIEAYNTSTDGKADYNEFRTDHLVTIRYTEDPDLDLQAIVTGTAAIAGPKYYIKIKLLEDDDNSASFDLSDADEVWVSGSAHEEGSMPPEAVNYIPTSVNNVTEIFKTVLDLSGTADAITYRTGDALKNERRDKLELHGIEMEKAFLWGVFDNTSVGSNNKPKRSTRGIKNFIREYASQNIFNYTTDTDYAGKTWLEGGEDWLDEKLEIIFRYGDSERLALCGNLALLGIQKLAKAHGHIILEGREMKYGIKVTQWITPFGTLYLKSHPLFNLIPSMRRTMLVLHPKYLKYRYLKGRDTKRTDVTPKGYDGIKEQYLTECGLEMHHPETFAMLHNLGKDNPL